MKALFLSLFVLAVTGAAYWKFFSQKPEHNSVMAQKAYDTQPLVESGFSVFPLSCDATACKFRLHILPYNWCRWGDIDTIHAALAGEKSGAEMLITLESLRPDAQVAPVFAQRVAVSQLEKGMSAEISVPREQSEGEFGLFLCRDQERVVSCKNKLYYDIMTVQIYSRRVKRVSSSAKLEDANFAFQYLYLSSRDSKAWSFSGVGTPVYKNMQSFIMDRKRAAFLTPVDAAGLDSTLERAHAIQSFPLRQLSGDPVLLLPRRDGTACPK